MGIPKFFGQWIKRKVNRSILTNYIPPNVSSLAIDMNSIFHKIAQKVYSYGEYENKARSEYITKLSDYQLEQELFNGIGTELLKIITLTHPADTLIMAVDGSAPVAKMFQQRQRRYLSALKGLKRFNPNSITPGTDFMFRLDEFIRGWIMQNRTILPENIIYSSHMVVFEGEQKIFYYYREGIVERNNKSNGVHIVYGLDADLILLSMLSPVRDIFMVRDDISDVLNINNFRMFIMNLISRDRVDDFVILTYFLGNDFIPNLLYLLDMESSMDLLIELYKQANVTLTQNNNINWAGLAKFLTLLSNKEPELIKNALKYKNQIRAIKESIVDNELDYSKFSRLWYSRELSYKHPCFDKEISQAEIQSMNIDYLVTIAWTYRYYYSGNSDINTIWFYPYFRAPLTVDLVKTIAERADDIIGYKPISNPIYYNPLYQLLAVLPSSNHNLIPKELNFLMISQDSEIYDLFPKSFIIDTEGRPDEFPIVIIPPPEMDRIVESVDKVLESINSLKAKYTPKRDLILGSNLLYREFVTKEKKLKDFLRDEINKRKHKYQPRSLPKLHRGLPKISGYTKAPAKESWRKKDNI